MGYYSKHVGLKASYVTATDRFVATTVFRCERLPKAWAEFTTGPLVRTAEMIQTNVRAGNRVWIDKDHMQSDELIAAIQQRIAYLSAALQLFSDYDAKFDAMMMKIDLKSYETKRLKMMLMQVIDDINNSVDMKANQNTFIANMKVGINDISYETMLGTKVETLKLTHKNVEVWQTYRKAAYDLIADKVSADRRWVSSLKKAA